MPSTLIEFSRVIWPSSPILLTLLWGSILLSLYSFVKWVKATPRSKFPPGPKGIPIFGNVFQLGAQPWHMLSFAEWNKLYGPMVYLNLAGQHMIILNDSKIASELLDRRAGIYSDRPRNIVGGEILTGGIMLAFMRYGDLWRRMRRAAHEALNMTIAPQYHPTQQCEAIILADDLIKNPENWTEHVERAAASAIASTVYDMRPLKSTKDPSIATANDMSHRLARALQLGAHMVEVFPILRYAPRSLAKWKRDAQDFFSSYSKVFEGTYAEIKTRVLKGEEQRPSFCATLAETSSRHNMTNLEASWLAATIYLGGADSSAAVLMWFMLAMIAFPETQRKAQAEIDEVVGRARPPSFSDWDHLPYLRAIVKEVIRWRPPGPQAVPHTPTQDDWYEGYFIPKGTICLLNLWAMNHDTNVFGPDALEFNPSRHLDENGKLKPSPETKEEGHFGFGFGRRACVGRIVANYSAFIHMATILWALKLEPPKDAKGRYVPPDLEARVSVDDNLSEHPARFKCTITPRFPDVESIVQRAREEAMEKRELPIHIVKPLTVKST